MITTCINSHRKVHGKIDSKTKKHHHKQHRERIETTHREYGKSKGHANSSEEDKEDHRNNAEPLYPQAQNNGQKDE